MTAGTAPDTAPRAGDDAASGQFVTIETVRGEHRGVCTCGWRSVPAPTRAEAARDILQHTANSSCHALIGEPVTAARSSSSAA